jgi:hypothetical protein
MSWFIAQRKAVRVFPLPVGAVIRACFPAATRGQARPWISVGVPSRSANQRRMTGWNRERVSF